MGIFSCSWASFGSTDAFGPALDTALGHQRLGLSRWNIQRTWLEIALWIEGYSRLGKLARIASPYCAASCKPRWLLGCRRDADTEWLGQYGARFSFSRRRVESAVEAFRFLDGLGRAICHRAIPLPFLFCKALCFRWFCRYLEDSSRFL